MTRFLLALALLLSASCNPVDSRTSDSIIEDEVIVEKPPTSNEGEVELSLLELDFERAGFIKPDLKTTNPRIRTRQPISAHDYLALESIILDSSSYQQYSAACFHPNFGLVKISPDGSEKFEMYGCLSCNNAHVYLNDESVDTIAYTIPHFGFSEKARGKIKAILKVYNHDVDKAFYPMFDNPFLYLQNQLSQGRDSLDIMQDFDWGDRSFTEPEIERFGPLYEWRKRPAEFFADENIDQLVYEYNRANDDRFTHYIGKVELEEGRYHVCTVFARNQAAMVMHGHSDFFILDADQNIYARYNTGMPDLLPVAIENNQLVFETEDGRFYKDADEIKLPYLCLPDPINCIEKAKLD